MYAAAIEKNPLMLSRKNLRSSSRGSDQRCGHCPCSDGGPLFLTLPPLRTGCEVVFTLLDLDGQVFACSMPAGTHRPHGQSSPPPPAQPLQLCQPFSVRTGSRTSRSSSANSGCAEVSGGVQKSLGERGSCAPARRGKRLEETGHTLPGIWPNSASMVWRRLLTGAGLAWAASSVLNVYLICRCVWQGAARGRMRWLWACMTKAD